MIQSEVVRLILLVEGKEKPSQDDVQKATGMHVDAAYYLPSARSQYILPHRKSSRDGTKGRGEIGKA